MAPTAEEAWDKVQNPANCVTVVIADIHVPGEFDGIGLLNRVTTLEKDIVSIIMTSEQGADIASISMHGSYDLIAKPLVKPVLLKKLDMLIQHRQFEQQAETDRNEKVALKKEIGELAEQILRIPAQCVIDLIVALLGTPKLTPELRAKVESLRDLIVQHSNLYRPTLAGQTNSLDSVTRSFLLHQLSLYEPYEPTADFVGTFPKNSVEDPKMYELMQWTFDVFRYSEDELLVLVKQMFVYLDLLTQFNIQSDVLQRFLVVIKQMYKPNPYHNWVHAVDVTQATFCFLIQFEGLTKLTCLDRLALLVASLCHDLGHPGVTNSHLISTQSDLALLYNDQSVLENFHASCLFQLLHEHKDLNIFASLTKEQYKEVRKSITDCILATDMANHYEYVTKLGMKTDSGHTEWDCNSPDQRLLLMKCIIKLADISNVARSWNVSVEWSRRISEEFFAQGSCDPL